MKKIDLHIHTIFSDGTLSPQEVVRIAYKCDLLAIAIADHDEVNGVIPAQMVGKDLGIEVIPAVEFSSKKEGKSIHILGYFIDVTHPELIAFIDSMRKARLERAEKIVHKLREHGIYIKVSDIEECAGPGVICRPHIAEILVNKKVVSNLREAFTKYIGWDKPCYVPKADVPTECVIKLILKAGGIPVLAHPSLSDTNKWIKELVDEGLMGIEAWYPTHSESDINHYLKIANEYMLVPTGGSDSHGTREKYSGVCEFSVPYEVLDRLIELYNKMVNEK